MRYVLLYSSFMLILFSDCAQFVSQYGRASVFPVLFKDRANQFPIPILKGTDLLGPFQTKFAIVMN